MVADALTCPGCGLPYDQTPAHKLLGADLVAYCELCHCQLTLGAKKSHITGIINEWREQGCEVDTVWQIALDVADWEHFIQWGKV